MIGSVVAARALHCKTVPEAGILIHIHIHSFGIRAGHVFLRNFRASHQVYNVNKGKYYPNKYWQTS